MKKNSHSTALLPLLSLSAVLHSALMLFVFPQNTAADHSGMAIWWTCLCLAYIAMCLYLRRPRTLRGVLIIAAAALALQLWLTAQLGSMPQNGVGKLLMVSPWGYGYYRCALGLLKGPTPEQLLSVFELTVVMLLTAAVCGSLGVMGYGNLYHLGMGLVLSLLSLARLRRGHRRMSSAGSGSGVIVAALTAIGICAGLFALLATGNANALLTRFTARALGAWNALVDSLGRVIYWLLSLMPDLTRETTGEPPAEEVLPLPEIAEQELLRESDVLIVLLLIGAMAGGAYLLLRLWRSRHRFRIRTLAAPVGQVTRVGRSFGDILREQWARWKALTAYIRRYLRHRGTAEGLLVWLELRMALRRKPRKTGESPRRFLERVAAMTPACEEGLRNLADCLDRLYFGHGAAMPREEVTALRRQLRRALGAIQK